MDHPSASDVPGPGIPNPQPAAAATGVPLQLRDRRRQKPLLSCLFCRSRKVRCDRQLPCETCTSKGIGLSCTYKSPSAPRKGQVSVGDRIQQLEALVRSLVQQQQPPQQTVQISAEQYLNGPSTIDQTPQYFFQDTSSSPPLGDVNTRTVLDDDNDTTTPSQSKQPPFLPPSSRNHDNITSPAPSEAGSMRPHAHGASYVGSVHWAAVLDSISALREHYEEEEEEKEKERVRYYAHTPPDSDYPSLSAHCGPRLLYEPLHLTKEDVLASVPPRPVVDRMVGRHFNAQGVVPEVLHRGKFLREYERFWQDPASASFIWIGLLFSIMCLSTQFHESIEEPPQATARVHVFRERTVQCLVLGQYTRGGDYVLETLITYLCGEMLLSLDADVGLWLVQGMLVQLALSLGYHRDPHNFPHISPFAGEMRRRVWAIVVQIDLRMASQIGLPRLLKLQHCDTSPPRNLFDADFDEDTTTSLPPSRPDTEITPILYTLARNKIDSLSCHIIDLVDATTTTHTHSTPYTETLALHAQARATEASLPSIFHWHPLTLAQSLLAPPQVVMHRVFLQLALQRLTIWLHRRYLAASYAQGQRQQQYRRSRTACLRAAVKILELQRLVEEETATREGLLWTLRCMFRASSRVQAVYLLGMSILCYHLQVVKSRGEGEGDDVCVEEGEEEEEDDDDGGEEIGTSRIRELLRSTYPLWLRSSTVSMEARQAVEHLSRLLGLGGGQEGDGLGAAVATVTTDTTSTPFAPLQNGAMSFDELTWGAYQECIANFPSAAVYNVEPSASADGSVSMADLLLTDSAEQDDVWTILQ